MTLLLCWCGHLNCDHDQRMAPRCDGGGVGCNKGCQEFREATEEETAALNALPLFPEGQTLWADR